MQTEQPMGWDRKLILKIKDDKIMTITSFGKDGKPGGEGEDADIAESHWLRKEDGSLWVGEEMWVVDSEITSPRGTEAGGGT